MNPARRAIESASQAFGIPVSAIMGPQRSRPICHARWAAMKLLREREWGLSDIGRGMGLDHTSVLHALRRTAELPDNWRAAYAKAREIMGDYRPRPWKVVYARPIGPPEAPLEHVERARPTNEPKPKPKTVTHDDFWAAKMDGARFGSVRVRDVGIYREAMPDCAREI